MNKKNLATIGVLVMLVLLSVGYVTAWGSDMDHFMFLPLVLSVVCDCSGNIYNCADFATQAHAQVCFDYCVAQGVGDVHKLDRDNDGIACENLPNPTQTLTPFPTVTLTPITGPTLTITGVLPGPTDTPEGEGEYTPEPP